MCSNILHTKAALLKFLTRDSLQLLDSGVELLASRAPWLESLDISHCSKLTGASLRSISKVRSLLTLFYST